MAASCYVMPFNICPEDIRRTLPGPVVARRCRSIRDGRGALPRIPCGLHGLGRHRGRHQQAESERCRQFARGVDEQLGLDEEMADGTILGRTVGGFHREGIRHRPVQFPVSEPGKIMQAGAGNRDDRMDRDDRDRQMFSHDPGHLLTLKELRKYPTRRPISGDWCVPARPSSLSLEVVYPQYRCHREETSSMNYAFDRGGLGAYLETGFHLRPND